MITYKQAANWWKEKENKNKVAVGVSFVLIFLVGFGTGSYTREIRRDAYKPQSNYTTQQIKKPLPTAAHPGEGTVAAVATGTPVSACVIKGNISSGGKKIYHVKGGAFYARVKPEQCFNTEAEAVAAGFVKSGR